MTRGFVTERAMPFSSGVPWSTPPSRWTQSGAVTSGESAVRDQRDPRDPFSDLCRHNHHHNHLQLTPFSPLLLFDAPAFGFAPERLFSPRDGVWGDGEPGRWRKRELQQPRRKASWLDSPLGTGWPDWNSEFGPPAWFDSPLPPPSATRFCGFSKHRRRPQPPTPPPQIPSTEVLVSLEDLLTGTTKTLSVETRGRRGDTRETRLTVQVPPGAVEGCRLLARGGGGGDRDGGRAMVLEVTLKSMAHAHYSRDGANLIYTAQVSLTESLCGCTVTVPTLGGRLLPMPCRSVLKPGTVKRLRGEGLPIPGSTAGKRGDLIIAFCVSFPRHIEEASRKIIAEHLPAS